MHNPLRGVVTSEHEDDGGYYRHRGRDIGTRDLGTSFLPVWVYGVGRPVYAAFSGRWKKVVRSAKPGNRTSTWAPTRTGNGGLVANPDGEGNGYNHVLILAKWSEGDWVDEGDLIGHLDLSGNMNAPHLHFEMWSNWRDPYSDYSPKIVFDKYGVGTMDDPTVTITPAATPIGGLTVTDINAIMDKLATVEAEVRAANTRIDNVAAEQRGKALSANEIAAAVWDHPLTYRDQSRGTDREVPAGQHQHYQSWGNAKIIDALTLKES